MAPAVGAVKSAYCSTWEHPAARLLLGDHLHPGGRQLTRTVIEATDTRSGDVVLDVGCNHGAALRVMQELGLRPIGIDPSLRTLVEAADCGSVVAGEGEYLPFADGSVDGTILECVVSLLVDKQRALGEVNRVLKEGGRMAVSDVVVDGPLPPILQTEAAWSCCLGGAIPRTGYTEIITRAGFEVIEVSDHTTALMSMIEQAKRRMSLLQISAVVGATSIPGPAISPGIFERGRDIAASLDESIRAGGLGYALFVAQKRT